MIFQMQPLLVFVFALMCLATRELGPLLFVASHVKSHNVTKSRLKWTLDPSWGSVVQIVFSAKMC